MFHVHSEEARGASRNRREVICEVFPECLDYQVDVGRGDASATCYRYFRKQRTPSIKEWWLMV